MKNEVTVKMTANSHNEGFARICVAGFVASLNPTVEEITEIKTAVSEAVTNAIIHGYEGKDTKEGKDGTITMHMKIEDNTVYIEICDEGIGIHNIEEAMTPLYTSKPDMERSGIGFSVMESFMDSIRVESLPGSWTKVILSKIIEK